MNYTGIVAEYNPLHNAHQYHMAEARRLSGNQGLIVVMSGDFVQRGEPAVANKRTRAEWALRAGADMVLELPLPFALSSAEGFAKGGMGVLLGTGLVNAVAFGSESGDADLLSRVAGMLDQESEKATQGILLHLSNGLSYPAARAAAYRELLPKAEAACLENPNDILGIEYIRALRAFQSAMRPIPVKRTGSGHDSSSPFAQYASAAHIRANLFEGGAAKYLPEFMDLSAICAQAPNPERLSALVLYSLRLRSLEELALLPDVSEGFEYSLYKASRSAASYDELLLALKTKRYTLARIKRICMCALLNISPTPFAYHDLYIRVLGVRRDSAHLLSELAARASLPVILRHSDLERLSPGAASLHAASLRGSDISALLRGKAAGYEYSAPLLVV